MKSKLTPEEETILDELRELMCSKGESEMLEGDVDKYYHLVDKKYPNGIGYLKDKSNDELMIQYVSCNDAIKSLYEMQVPVPHSLHEKLDELKFELNERQIN